MSTESRARAFYDALSSQYDAQLDVPDARRHRACFWAMAAALLPSRAHILDFGAGTGIDAAHYAQAGHTVVAYDISPGMMSVLSERCATAIASGTIHPVCGTLDDLRGSHAGLSPFDAVISNFAVLNLIRDLDPVIRHFASVVRQGGLLLLTVQNPWFLGDITTIGFWRAWLGFFTSHRLLRYESAATGETWRHLPTQVRRLARPEFRPVRVRSLRAAGCRHSFGAVGVFRLLAFERV